MYKIFQYTSPLTIAAAGLLSAAPAFAETEFTTDISVGAGASTNPFLANGQVPSTASGSVTVAPRLRITELATTFDLRGYGRIEEYEKNFRSNTSFGADASVEHGISERTQLTGQIGYRGSIVGTNDGFFNTPDLLTESILPTVADDIALNGLNQRRHTFQTGVGITHSLSPQDSISANLAGTAVRFGDSFIQDEYNFFSQNLGYSRVLSERTSIGASLGLGQSNYLDQRQGDSLIITPTVNVTQQLSEYWSISGSAGVSIARVKDIVGTTKTTDLSASLDLCRAGESGKFCLSARRQTLPSSFDGIRSQTSFDLGYSQRITRKDDISITAGYSRSSNPSLGGTQNFEYIRSSATLNHKFTDRITGFVSAGYSDSFQTGINRRANTQVSVGIRLRVGNFR